MGTQEGGRDWVDVANELLSKCHINLQLRQLTECDANVFMSLYENILGEKVPDNIAEPQSQEDDIHNVQSVIDSLSLDYLHISLSHITGENVVRGDRKSIKNLLDIFDGLVEYLNEEIREDSQNSEEPSDSLNEVACGEAGASDQEAELVGACSSSNEGSIVQSSKHSWNTGETGSTSEVIGLGMSARTFADKQEGLTLPWQTSAAPPDDHHVVPQHSALQPLQQSNAPQTPGTDPPSPKAADFSAARSEEEEEVSPACTETPPGAGPATAVTNGLPSAAHSEESLSSRLTGGNEVDGEMLQPTSGGPRRVLFHPQTDVLFLRLQDDMRAATPSPPDTEEEEDGSRTPTPQERGTGHTGLSSRSWLDVEEAEEEEEEEEEGFSETLSYRRQRRRQTEMELHLISEKLSHRLQELDQMLKRVLNESGGRDEDKQSHHSDSVMERRRTPGPHAGPDPESSLRTRSLSPPPPRAGQPPPGATKAFSLDGGRRPHRTPPARVHQPSEPDELRTCEDKDQTDLDKTRLSALEAERSYREALLRDVSTASTASPAKTDDQRPSHRHAQTRRVRQEIRRKTATVRVKDHELLPLLLDELPHLHISSQALGRMQEQQQQQVDRLHALSSPHSRRRSKLSRQLQEAERKRDLLVRIIHRDQEHSRRLTDFKERVQQQRSAQNRMTEQRQQAARAKRYHQDYHVQHRARLMRARTKEERMFRQLFEEGLQLQKVRLREQRAQAREQQLENQRRHQDHIQSMENYYKDQFSLLAEKLAQERREIQVRKKAQEKALLKMKRELRSRMEREIGDLQRIIVQNNEDDFFQDLEIQRLRGRLHMASFQYHASCLH